MFAIKFKDQNNECIELKVYVNQFLHFKWKKLHKCSKHIQFYHIEWQSSLEHLKNMKKK